MKLAVALIHGIGDQPDSRDEDGLHSYARELVAALRRRLGAEAGEVAFQSLYWASVLDARELDYLKRIEREPLGWRWLRRAVTLFLGDASGYRKVSAAYDTTYQQVHQHVRSGIMALRAKVGPQTPLVILAHSWAGTSYPTSSGTSRNSTARRVARSPLPRPGNPGRAGHLRLQHPAVHLRLREGLSDPLSRPLPAPAIRQQARWLNVYAPADPLGYPLRPLQNYTAVVHEDLALPVGPWYKRHTPLSHMEYWNDARFHDYLADYLRRLLAAGLEPAGAGRALPQASQEIGRLLSFVEDSGCTFIRNGSEYPAAEARAHLQKKLDYLERRDLVASSEDFIERAATQSSLSGKPYQVRCATQTRNSADWLNQELRRLRQAPDQPGWPSTRGRHSIGA